MTLLIYRHLLKRNVNYSDYENTLASINHSDVTGYGIGQRGTQRGEFCSLDKISSRPLCYVLHTSQPFFSHVTFSYLHGLIGLI